MAYDKGVAERVREVLSLRQDVVEKKMFGGIAFMVSGHMCCGVVDDMLMARVGPDQYQSSLEHPSASEMDFTGKPLKGFVYVSPEGFETKEDLSYWINLCEDFVDTLPAK